MSDPVEVTTRYVTSVPDLASAWAFVMTRLELVGPEPHIEIKPLHRAPLPVSDLVQYGDEGLTWELVFEVVVGGMVREAEESA